MKQLSHLDHLLYPVEKVESKSLLPDFEFTPAQEYAIVMNKNGTKKIVNHCSKIYEVVPNRMVLEPLLKTMDSNTIAITGSGRFDSRFAFDIMFKDQAFNIGKGDDVFPRLRINNSYDGRVKYSFNLGFFRLICSNGLVIPVEGFEDKNIQLKMRHTPALGEIVEPEIIMEMVHEFKSGMLEFTKPFKELGKKQVHSLEERIQEIIENTKFPTRRAEDVLDTINAEMVQLRLGEKQVTDWLVYNGFNYQLNHSEDINMDSHKREKIDQQVLTYLLNN